MKKEYVWRMQWHMRDGRCYMRLQEMKEGKLVDTGWVCEIGNSDPSHGEWLLRRPNGKIWRPDKFTRIYGELTYLMRVAEHKAGEAA